MKLIFIMPLITQIDFLNPLFSLNPIIMGVVILISGAGSLLVYGMMIRKVQSLAKPSFIIGDFILLPLIGVAMNYFYQGVDTPTKFVNSYWWLLLTGLIALLLGIISIIRFDLLKPLFIPHLVFVFLMTYAVITFLTKGFWQLVSVDGNTTLWLVYLFVLTGSILVKLLGIVYPKTFV